jgi:transposase
VSKTFRPWDVDQVWLLPPSVRELVPADDPANIVRDLVRNELDLRAIHDAYAEERGYPPYHPTMMTALLLYAYTQGVYSSRRIARACHHRVDFMAITAMQKPDFRTVSEFRKRHLEALGGLFQQVLRLCARAGLVQLGHVALDGTKVDANASRHKAMSYEHMKKKEKELAATVAEWFAKAAAADAAEDEEYGADKRGDEMPEWMRDKEQRLARIRAAKAELEAEAKAQLKAEAAQKEDGEGPRRPPGRGKKRPKKNGEPHDKAQLNFTDRDSRIMKGPKGYMQAYNCQLAVDAAHQVIVAQSVSNEQNDSPQLIPMVAQIRKNLGRQAREISADSNFLSEANLADLARRRVRSYVALGRKRHGDQAQDKARRPQGRRTLAMGRKIARAGHRSRYRLRKQVVEPTIGQIKEARGFRRFLLRGLRKVPHEWALVCAAHNLVKLIHRAA